ncbi:hypothetical protein [Nocardia macrotermitis]|uniref:Uncharacterized protein n=1 Tax=Nocardia macrotermitis TaxID=2585198 RepID=A0A7K0D0B1_9NOCA|nr:hypothetical protein [Nocardia macrotermitis]MQY18374.1 hypothetical protein [Nocardia macrotermitis]
MTLGTDRTGRTTLDINARLSGYSLMDALLWRRSRRFAPGMEISGGPLSYRSTAAPRPLTTDEEAALAFAACGITGHTLAEMPYQEGDRPGAGGGNIIAQLVGRTIASGDGIHSVSLFVINDEGVSLVRRPQDLDRAEIPELIRLAHGRELRPLYDRVRVRVSDRRVDVPREVPFVPPFNQYSTNVPGTTYFLPVAELTALMINLLLSAFEDDFGFYVLDERNRFQPAGLAKFARSRGGHLNDDLSAGRVVTAGFLDTWLREFAAIEQGAMLQNLGLMTQALGLGGFPHFAAHPFVWYQELGFRMRNLRLSRTIGANPLMAAAMSLTGRDMPMPTAVGFEHQGKPLLRPYCPPYYRNMEEAVLAFVDFKYAPGSGTLRDGGAQSSWHDGGAVQNDIPKVSDNAIAATIAYLEYLHNRYGRVPADNGPFRTVLAYQAANLDEDFYNRYYVPDALSPAQRDRA